MKILLAVDGSEASLAAVEEAARTPWPEASLVRIVSVAEIPFQARQWGAPMPCKARGADGKTMRILLAVDGSEFSDAAVEEIANRPWPPGSEVHVISVIHLPFEPGPEV